MSETYGDENYSQYLEILSDELGEPVRQEDQKVVYEPSEEVEVRVDKSAGGLMVRYYSTGMHEMLEVPVTNTDEVRRAAGLLGEAAEQDYSDPLRYEGALETHEDLHWRR